MKDFSQIWSRVTGRHANSADREMRELSNNRLKRSDMENAAFDANLSECEGLTKFEDVPFSDRKDEIINRLFERRKKGQYARQPKCLFMLLMFGFISIAIGCFIMFAHPYDFFFKMKVRLQPGGEIFELWRKPEVDLYCRIFLFNITNAEEYMAGTDSVIKVKEVGPYVYKESLEHEIVEFNDNGTLSAIPKHPLTWVEELSEGHKEDDVLYLPHIALLSIANVASSSLMARFGLNRLISVTNSQPLAKMTAKEFMMGYKSNLMTLGNTFMPGWIKFDKLGLIDRMYDFQGDYETIFTGEDDVSLSGLIDTYKGSTELSQWEGECSNVQYASDGTKFMGAIGDNQTLKFYRKSLCRAAPLVPKEKGVKSNLEAIMYSFPDHMMDNGAVDERNKCYCRKGRCLPEGLIDVTDCYYGFPIALSYPHFYEGDPKLFHKIEGLSPNKDLHETRFWIQPASGLPLDVSTKFQINLALDDISTITNTEKFSNIYLPLLWFDIRMYSLPPSLEQRFNLYLNILPLVEQAAMYLLFITGAILIIITVYRITFKIMFKSFDNKPHNFVLGTDLWVDREKKRNNKDGIYAPCEIPLNDTFTNYDKYDDVKHSLTKTHVDRIKELNNKLSDKVYDSVGSMKDKVREFVHVKNIFLERKDSLLKKEALPCEATNEGYTDSSDNDNDNYGKYKAVKQYDTDDDCPYLEVLDDGSQFDGSRLAFNSERSQHLQELERENDLIINISD